MQCAKIRKGCDFRIEFSVILMNFRFVEVDKDAFNAEGAREH